MKSVNTDVAYDHIRKRILSGDYPPGHSLLTEAIASELNLSRTPIRDALRKLELDGLVTIQPHLGASVKTMDVEEYRQTSELRLALEVHAAGLAATNRTEKNLFEIRTALQAMSELAREIINTTDDKELIRRLVHEDMRFHVGIITAAENDVIKKEILRLHLINRVVMSGQSSLKLTMAKPALNERLEIVQAEHVTIFDAIAGSDPLGAKQAMESHLQDMIQYSLRTLTSTQAGHAVRTLTPEEQVYHSPMFQHMT